MNGPSEPTASAASHARARAAFRQFNRFMVLLWRLGLGRLLNGWPAVGGRVMVVVHTGRRTGTRRLTPLNYSKTGSRVHCIAGFGAVSDWHRNLRAHPDVEVWLPDGRWSGVASDVSDSESRLALLREVLIASGFASYLAGIRPRTIDDAELARRTVDYRAHRIDLERRLSGPGGPGDLAWLWPVVILLLLALFLIG